jgi:hypothetical protein
MLLFLADRDPRWRAAANERIEEFIRDPTKRNKDHTDNLGR